MTPDHLQHKEPRVPTRRAMARRCLAIIAGLHLGLPALVQGQTDARTDQAAEIPTQRFLEAMDEIGDVGTNETSPAPPEISLSPETLTAYQDALKASYERDKWSYRFKERIYEWQLTASKVIFFMVIFLVLVGVYFSWIQFRVSLGDRPLALRLPNPLRRVDRPTRPAAATDESPRPAKNPQPPGQPGDPAPGESAEVRNPPAGGDLHRLEASMAGIKLSTSVLGVVILAMSLLFFYLYLQFIYPIN